MAFSIDCSHFFGQSAQPNIPTVVMQAGCDCNLWFWHCVFGYVGTMNDINIWDSRLNQSLHDGSYEKNGFDFEIGGKYLISMVSHGWDLSRTVLLLLKQSVSHWTDGKLYFPSSRRQRGRM
jgi:hypothetical protein